MPALRIALLEDDESQRDLIERFLTQAGYLCSSFAQGKALRRSLTQESYDACLLDWEVPDLTGEELLVWMRSHMKEYLPVLFVTARAGEDDIVRALDAGADDYMIKPVGERELIARLGALLRRTRGRPSRSRYHEMMEFRFDLELRTLTRHGEAVKVTSKDFDVALFLLSNVGRLLSRGHIYEAVWGRSANISSRTVDTHVSRVRVKLGLVPEHGWQVTPIYQYGYRLMHLPALSGAPDPGAGA